MQTTRTGLDRTKAVHGCTVLRRFSWLSLVAIIAVFALGSLLLAQFLNRHFVQRDAALTMEMLQSVVDAENEQAYRDGRPPHLRDRRFDEFFDQVSRLPDVLRANIYTPDGTRVWSIARRQPRVAAATSAPATGNVAARRSRASTSSAREDAAPRGGDHERPGDRQRRGRG